MPYRGDPKNPTKTYTEAIDAHVSLTKDYFDNLCNILDENAVSFDEWIADGLICEAEITELLIKVMQEVDCHAVSN